MVVFRGVFVEVIVLLSLSFVAGQYGEIPTKDSGRSFLREYDGEASQMCNQVATAEWKFTTNSSDYNRRRMKEQRQIAAKFKCLSWKQAQVMYLSAVDDESRNHFEKILQHGYCGLNESRWLDMQSVLSHMDELYTSTRICPYYSNLNSEPFVRRDAKCSLELEPDLVRVMQRSRKEDELRYAYVTWRESTGPKIRNSFMRYIDLANQDSRNRGYGDAGEKHRASYQDPNFSSSMQQLWSEIMPLYKLLFSYVRKGLLATYYGSDALRPDGPIPAHFLGDVWSRNWENILELIKPDAKVLSSVTNEMIRQGYTAQTIYHTAENFFYSIGFPPMPPEFWRNSILHRSNEVLSQCKPSAWDFCNGNDFRIHHCTKVELKEFVLAHKKMTKIQYFMEYSSKPYVFRTVPNPAFYEALSVAVELNVGAPTHLARIGLISDKHALTIHNSTENIEYLLNIALQKFPEMAFSLTLAKWKWDVFQYGPVGMNQLWWEYHLKFMGLTPPSFRNKDNFDAGSTHEALIDEDYIKHFVGNLAGFQLFSEMCQVARQSGPLHMCDISKSRDAGRILIDIMQAGASISPNHLYKHHKYQTSNKLSTEAFLEYFRPLENWLKIQTQNDPIIGWNSNLDDVSLFKTFNSGRRLHYTQLFQRFLLICNFLWILVYV